jgi:hypothetical protein
MAGQLWRCQHPPPPSPWSRLAPYAWSPAASTLAVSGHLGATLAADTITSVKMVEIAGSEVAISHAARGGIWVMGLSVRGTVSSTMPSICM